MGNNLANDTPIKIAQAGTPAGCPQIVFLGCAEYKTFKNVFGIDRQNTLPIALQEQVHTITSSSAHHQYLQDYFEKSWEAGRLLSQRQVLRQSSRA